MNKQRILHFVKYEGAGNDFIMVNNMENTYSFLTDNTGLMSRLCNRKFGVGGDGLIELKPGADGQNFYMKYYNADGQESTLCGNGARCAVLFSCREHIIDPGDCTFTACDGYHAATSLDADHNSLKCLVKVQMKDVANIEHINEQAYLLNTGSPHYVEFVDTNLKQYDVEYKGSGIRYSKDYKTQGGVNVNFVEVKSSGDLNVRTYERGVEAETLACGTGAVASALASYWKTYVESQSSKETSTSDAYQSESGLTSNTTDVSMPGGKLSVTFSFDRISHTFTNVWLCGPAKEVFIGHMLVTEEDYTG